MMKGLQFTRTHARTFLRRIESQRKGINSGRILESKRTFKGVSRLSCENQSTRTALALSLSDLRYSMILPEDSLAKAWINALEDQDDDGT